MINGVPAFVKWAGGKKQIINQLKDYFPKKINRYFDPFVGGGAVAFYVIKTYSPNEIYISDINEDLIITYKAIKKDVESLIKKLDWYKSKHSKTFYYETRSLNPENMSDLDRAARFIYLNKTCFNGLYRVNSNGRFNVPIGSYKTPYIYDEKDLREISKLLKNATIEVKQFYCIENYVKSGDFIYFDPPYYPVSGTSNFTAYTKDGFFENEHKRLATLFSNLDKKGANVMMSNSDTRFIRNLYKNYNIYLVKAKRSINSDSSGRGKINEIVITNY